MHVTLRQVVVFGFLCFMFHRTMVEACQDESQCSELENWCSDDLVKSWCPKMCLICEETTAAPTTTTSDPCIDDHPQCPGWESFCESSPWMLDNCKKTCKLCGSGGWSECSKTCGTGSRHREKCENEKCEWIFETCSTQQCPEATCNPPKSQRYGIIHDCCEGEIMTAESKCGQTYVGGKVVGGESAKLKQWPWMVSIVMDRGKLCSGVLISKRYFLSAAHCFVNERGQLYNREKWKLHAGILRLSDPSSGTELQIKKVTLHPKYEFPANDIAIVRIEKRVKFSASIQPICLPGGEITPLDTTCYVSGWGMSDHSLGGATDHLQEAGLQNLDRRNCRKYYGSDNSMTHVMSFLNADTGYLCAGRLDESVDSCGGDSGGPLACQRCSSCTWYLAGIVSFGSLNCGTIPGVYSEVRAHEGWISNVTGITHSERSCAWTTGP